MSGSRFSRPPQPQRQPIRGWHLVGLLAASAGVYLMGQYYWLRKTYTEGEQAYTAANCQVAIAEFDWVINKGEQFVDFNDYIARARAKKAECQAFQDVVEEQKTATPEAVLVAYEEFVSRYPSGALGQPIRQKTASLFEEAGIEALAQPSACERIDKLVENQLIPEPNQNSPSFYQACGQMYSKGNDYTNAVKMYEGFLENYPQHQLASEVELALAKSMVAEAKAQGAGKIERPGVSGWTVSGTTVVEIRNDSPEDMRIVFSGSEPRFEELERCEDCQKYMGTGPESCPAKGPVGRYTLKPGQYDVVVKSIRDGGVRPFTGTWVLDDGTEYNSCFFIVQQPGTEFEEQQERSQDLPDG